MKTPSFPVIATLLLLWSCSTEQKPSVVYTEEGTEDLAEQGLLKDTTLVLTGELPIYFDSTDYILFPIGPLEVSSHSKLDYGANGAISLTMGYLNGTTYTGNLDNIMIQHLDSTGYRPLTDQPLKIRSFRFLESIRKSTGLSTLVMTVSDRDTNRDGKLNEKDIESLYLSQLNGKGLKKLTPAFHELLDMRVLSINKKLYFRTLEDIDKNGRFNSKDKIHHFYVSLDNRQFNVIEYDPLK